MYRFDSFTSIETLRDDQQEMRKTANELIASGRSAVEFVEVGRGIHNYSYAMELLDYASGQFTSAIDLMGGSTGTATNDE